MDAWAQQDYVEYTCPLQELSPKGPEVKGSPRIGIHAGYFIEQYYTPLKKEPLVPALGGNPLGIEAWLVRQVRDIESTGCRVHFYFDGLNCKSDDVPIERSGISARLVSEAFDIYEASEASRAIERFRQAGKIKPRSESACGVLTCPQMYQV